MLTAQVIGGGSDGALRTPYFFNGRMLSAEDMQLEQSAGRLQLQRLAQALGAGVAHGLEVQVAGPGRRGRGAALRITPGLAFNRLGEAVSLATEVALAIAADAPVSPLPSRDFRDAQLEPAAPLPEVYLLTAVPATRLEGRVPATGLEADGRITGTGSAYSVEGVSFRLVPLRLPGDLAGAGTLRNALAHLCFGTETAAAFPPAVARPWAGLERLCAAGDLTAADVPLALLCWAGGSIQWVDAWAVRRRLQPAASPGWPLDLGPGRLGEVEAMLLQFQAHLADLQAQGDCGQVAAVRCFRYLPPLGYLPVGPGGFRPEVFFLGLPVAEHSLDPAFLRRRLLEAWFAEPVDLERPAPLLLYRPPGSEQALFLRRERAPSRRVVRATAVLLIEVSLPAALPPLDPGRVRVYAGDARGRVCPAEAVGGLYCIRSLAPGEHTVWALAPGCRAAGRRLTVRAGETVRLRFDLTPAAPAAGAEPPAGCDAAGWEVPPGVGRLLLGQEPLRWGELPEAVADWRLLAAPPPAVGDWLRAWAHWLLAARPEAPVDPDGIRVLADPGGGVDPYAYVVFGAGGVYLPLRPAPVAAVAPPRPGLLQRAGGLQAEALREAAEGEAALGAEAVPGRAGRRRGGWWRELVSFAREFFGLPPQE